MRKGMQWRRRRRATHPFEHHHSTRRIRVIEYIFDLFIIQLLLRRFNKLMRPSDDYARCRPIASRGQTLAHPRIVLEILARTAADIVSSGMRGENGQHMFWKTWRFWGDRTERGSLYREGLVIRHEREGGRSGISGRHRRGRFEGLGWATEPQVGRVIGGRRDPILSPWSEKGAILVCIGELERFSEWDRPVYGLFDIMGCQRSRATAGVIFSNRAPIREKAVQWI